MINVFKTTIAAAALGLMASAPVSALSVNFTATNSTGVPSGYGVDIGTASWITAPAIVNGSSGQFRSPYDELGAPGTEGYSDYFTVGSPSLVASPAVLSVGSRSTFRMLWGSVDTYNSVSFCNTESTLCAVVNGTQIASAAPADFSTGNAIVSFSAADGYTFNTISFRSDFERDGDQAAFEFAVAPVPLPAAGFLLIGALGGLAFLRRRKTA